MKIHRTYEWQEWLDAAKRGPADTPAHRNSDEWTGGSWADAYRMASTDGFHDALADAERLAGAVESHVLTDRLATTFEAHHDTAGAEVDIARFLSGEPECMVESVPLKIARRGRTVRIAVPTAYMGSVNESLVRRRGAAVMALIDCLSRAQHPLEVWAVSAATGSRDPESRYAYAVCVQHANEPLDMGRVMFALAHPTMLRRLAFSVIDQENAAAHKVFHIGHGYGIAPCDARESDLPPADGTTIVLPVLDHRSAEQWEDDAYVATWIADQLAAIFD